MTKYAILGGPITAYEHCSNIFQIGIISLMDNLSCESGQLMARYDFLGDISGGTFCNVRTDSNLI